MGFWDRLFGRESPADKASQKDARKLQEMAEKTARTRELFERALGNDPHNCGIDARQNAANQLLLDTETAKGREAWLSIARDYPDTLAYALKQVGVCYHLEQDYSAAIENYEAAIRVGADQVQLAANIAEARKELAALG